VDAPRTRRHSQKRSCHIETPDPPTEGAPMAPNDPRVFSKISYPQGIQAAAPSQASLIWDLTPRRRQNGRREERDRRLLFRAIPTQVGKSCRAD
jgi:hypothetical protein